MPIIMPNWPNPIGYRNIDLGLERVFALLARLGNPHLKMPPAIHIAGTNGKGSTLTFIKEIFYQHNLRIHSYISPHLCYFNERIIIANKQIDDDFLDIVLLKCKEQAEKSPKIEVTFFEAVTIAAIIAFSSIDADLLIFETGMGGRLDATNILDKILCAVITPISFDHQEFLGKDLSNIASQKAGIIKYQCPTIISKQEKIALDVITKYANNNDSQYYIYEEDFKITKSIKSSNQYHYNCNKSLFENKQDIQKKEVNYYFDNISLLGSHQIINLATALTASIVAANKLGINLENDKIATAIANSKWPARLERIVSGSIYNKIIDECNIQKEEITLILDGSHNIQGSMTVANFIDNFRNNHRNGKVIMINAMLCDKDYQGFVTNIGGKIDHYIASKISNENKSLCPKLLTEIIANFTVNYNQSNDLQEAIDLSIATIKQYKRGNDKYQILLIITGSLYFAGEFMLINN